MKHLIVLSTLAIIIIVNILTPVISPLLTEDSSRAQLEAQILSATVRVHFQTWVVSEDESGYGIFDSTGHATVKDGRYLVTHNHTEIPLSIRSREGDPESYTQISLYDALGRLKHEGPLSDFSIVEEEAEVLVFAHKEFGFLESLGFTSAQFRGWEQLTLEGGMEVAQIDWDGERTRVDWVSVSDITIENGVPQITLDDGALLGASGGGIFWRGYHIANNWRVHEKLDGAGEVFAASTTGALNSGSILSDAS